MLETNFSLLRGKELIGAFESSPGKQRCFCTRCGSPVYSKTEKVPGVVRICAGTLDGDLNTRPVAHFWLANKANWFEVNDDLLHFEQGYVPPTQ